MVGDIPNGIPTNKTMAVKIANDKISALIFPPFPISLLTITFFPYHFAQIMREGSSDEKESCGMYRVTSIGNVRLRIYSVYPPCIHIFIKLQHCMSIHNHLCEYGYEMELILHSPRNKQEKKIHQN